MQQECIVGYTAQHAMCIAVLHTYAMMGYVVVDVDSWCDGDGGSAALGKSKQKAIVQHTTA